MKKLLLLSVAAALLLGASIAAGAQPSVSYYQFYGQWWNPDATPAFPTGPNPMGIYFAVTDLPSDRPNCYCFHYLKPDGSESGGFWGGQLFSSWQSREWWADLDMPGTWHLKLLIDGVPALEIPFRVIPAFPPICTVIGNSWSDPRTEFTQAGWNLVGLRFVLENLPQYSLFQFDYVKPDGSIGLSTQGEQFGGPYAWSWWWYHWWVNLDTPGTWHLRLRVNGTLTASMPFEVCDLMPPGVSDVQVTPDTLWPPNHELRDVTVLYSVWDNFPTPTESWLTVTSDEPLTPGDIVLMDAHHLRLRAERLGTGDGRIYTITIHCRDAGGNVSTATAMVTVPHDQDYKVADDQFPQ